MKILVCLSIVPDTTSKINFTENDTQFDTQNVQFVINPNDEFGLTRAIWFKEKTAASVDVAHVGLATAEATLRKALAIGADAAIRVDAEPNDAFFVASELAKIIKENSYDLIICGRESIDYNGGAVPGMLAALLDYNFVTNCTALTIENDKATAIREIDGGSQTLICSLPLIIGAQKGLVEESDLRIPNMRGIMQARQKKLEVIAASENVKQSQTIKYYKPAPKGAVKLIPADELDQLINLLHNEANVL